MTRVQRKSRPNPALPGTVLLPLTKGQFAIIDADMDSLVCRWNWHVAKKRSGWYARRTITVDGRERPESLHRFLWNTWGGHDTPYIDHVNGNTLDNRRANLRAATAWQNAANSKLNRRNKTGYRGVHWDDSRRRFIAQIREPNGHDLRLGQFRTAVAAYEAYVAAARRVHGEFARVA